VASLQAIKQAIPLAWRKSAKIARVAAFERVGSYRYSMPSLDGLDRKMLERLPARGVFLEVGANDGYAYSNTYFLERAREWSGILIEPLPSLHERCRRIRPRSYCVQSACVAEDIPGATVELVDIDLMSVVLGQQSKVDENARLVGRPSTIVHAPARTISSIIDESPFERVDFMSVDVEGAEMPLLAGLDLQRHAPGWLLIETKYPEAVAEMVAPLLEISEQLSSHDYLFVRK
jgi:FkbM family methyltransferase